MDERDKKIQSLEKKVDKLEKQLSQTIKYIQQMEKRVNGTYHGHAGLANQVQTIAAQLQRIGR